MAFLQRPAGPRKDQLVVVIGAPLHIAALSSFTGSAFPLWMFSFQFSNPETLSLPFYRFLDFSKEAPSSLPTPGTACPSLLALHVLSQGSSHPPGGAVKALSAATVHRSCWFGEWRCGGRGENFVPCRGGCGQLNTSLPLCLCKMGINNTPEDFHED